MKGENQDDKSKKKDINEGDLSQIRIEIKSEKDKDVNIHPKQNNKNDQNIENTYIQDNKTKTNEEILSEDKLKNDSNLIEKENFEKLKELRITTFSYFITKKKDEKLEITYQSLSIPEAQDNYDNELDDDELAYLSKIPPKGLMNISGTCYMNATLQCFFHIKEFTNYFLKNKKYIKKKNGPISTGLLSVIEGLSKIDSLNYFVPEKFKNNLIKVNSSFLSSEGNDSGDLASLILLNCNEELGKEAELQNLSLDQRQQSLIFLDAFYKDMQAQSIILDLFSYYISVRNICYECGTRFYSISLDNMIIFNLENVFKYNAKDISIPKNKRIVSLDNCLSYFSFSYKSFENCKFTCKYCNKTSKLFNAKNFATLPKYLIMKMYRGNHEKFECQVDFDEIIDLKDSYSNVEGVPKEENTKYILCAGTILYGSKGYGHTVAFCKHFDGDYYIFDDTKNRKTNFNEIKKSKIYLLFYRKNIG